MKLSSFAALVRRRSTRFVAVAAVALALPSLSCGGGGGGGGGLPANAPVDNASVTPTPMAAAQGSAAGRFAADYLRATNFDHLVVEVDYPDDRPPTQASLDLLRDRLAERCDKPGGVTVQTSDAIPAADFPTRLSVTTLGDLEDTWRNTYSDAATRRAAMYVLYVHGHSDLDTQSQGVIGLSYRGGSFALFVDRVGETDAPPAVTSAEVEGTAIVHESGHLLGLVNNGVPMVQSHEDTQHRFHDASTACVMYFIVQVPFVVPNLGDPDFAQFDANCVSDLHAFGGLGPLPAVIRPASADTQWIPVGYCPCCAGKQP